MRAFLHGDCDLQKSALCFRNSAGDVFDIKRHHFMTRDILNRLHMQDDFSSLGDQKIRKEFADCFIASAGTHALHILLNAATVRAPLISVSAIWSGFKAEYVSNRFLHRDRTSRFSQFLSAHGSILLTSVASCTSFSKILQVVWCTSMQACHYDHGGFAIIIMKAAPDIMIIQSLQYDAEGCACHYDHEGFAIWS